MKSSSTKVGGYEKKREVGMEERQGGNKIVTLFEKDIRQKQHKVQILQTSGKYITLEKR